MNHYQVLHLRRHASSDEIRNAFLRLAHQWHPDMNRHDSEAKERFKQIRQAYDVLRHPELRASYDRQLSVMARAAQHAALNGNAKTAYSARPANAAKHQAASRARSSVGAAATSRCQRRYRAAARRQTGFPKSRWPKRSFRQSFRDWSPFVALAGGLSIVIGIVLFWSVQRLDRTESADRGGLGQLPSAALELTKNHADSAGLNEEPDREQVPGADSRPSGHQLSAAAVTTVTAESSSNVFGEKSPLPTAGARDIEDELWSGWHEMHRAVQDLSKSSLFISSASLPGASGLMQPLSVQRLDCDEHLQTLNQQADKLNNDVDLSTFRGEADLSEDLDHKLANDLQPIQASQELKDYSIGDGTSLSSYTLDSQSSWETKLSTIPGKLDFEWTLGGDVDFAPPPAGDSNPELATVKEMALPRQPPILTAMSLTYRQAPIGSNTWEKHLVQDPPTRNLAGWTDPNASPVVALPGPSLPGADLPARRAVKPIIPTDLQISRTNFQSDPRLRNLSPMDPLGVGKYKMATVDPRPARSTVGVVAGVQTLSRKGAAFRHATGSLGINNLTSQPF